MQNSFCKILLCFLLFISNGETKAQCLERTGMDCLGDWCIVDVSLSDPLVDNYLVYTIPKPPYAISGIYGPGMPRLFNDLGGTMDLYLRKFDLLPHLDEGDDYAILYLEMTVGTTNDPLVNDYGGHYHIKLILRR